MPLPRRKNPIPKLARALALIISRKQITRKLSFFKRRNKYKLFRHYNYAYIGEYQFSPSDTPLISQHRHHGGGFSKKRRSRILSLLCGGAIVGSMIETNLDFEEFEPLPVSTLTEERRVIEEENSGEGHELDNGEGREGEEVDDLSVDGRAERFIEKFYEEIRLERQQSFLQWKEMLQRSC